VTSRFWTAVFFAIAVALAGAGCNKDVVLGVAPGADAVADAGFDATTDQGD